MSEFELKIIIKLIDKNTHKRYHENSNRDGVYEVGMDEDEIRALKKDVSDLFGDGKSNAD